ncbi:MAG: ABC transporter ATP-binding protein [Bacteroidota bacterium]
MLVVENISKSFGSEPVLSDVSFTLAKGEMLSILGRSGSGKTTLLKILAGLQKADSRDVLLDAASVLHLRPQKREIVYLYQEALLFPHLNVFDNIAFGLRIRKEKKSLIREKVMDLVGKLELNGQEKKMPHQLSGGQKQRVSFGRALIINPRILLLDEPFGNLDPETRSNMQRLLKDIADTFSITAMFVTHDLKEAIQMGDRIGYMRKGSLDLYESHEAFVADPRTEARQEIEFWRRFDNLKKSE